jgi:ferritin-like metal-binding protein YciE
MQSMEDALLQDVYFVEKQLLKTLPKLAKKSTNEKLQEAFTIHRDETEGQVERLEKVFKAIGKKPRGKTCDAILGIIAEGQEIMDEVDDEALRDAGILAAAQAAEHYEIARYGTLRAWAELLGQEEAVELLSKTPAEEKHADELLTSIADGGVNESATEQELSSTSREQERKVRVNPLAGAAFSRVCPTRRRMASGVPMTARRRALSETGQS